MHFFGSGLGQTISGIPTVTTKGRKYCLQDVLNDSLLDVSVTTSDWGRHCSVSSIVAETDQNESLINFNLVNSGNTVARKKFNVVLSV